MGIIANQKSRDLLKIMASVSAFIVTAYAPFSITSLAGTARSKPFQHAEPLEGRADLRAPRR